MVAQWKKPIGGAAQGSTWRPRPTYASVVDLERYLSTEATEFEDDTDLLKAVRTRASSEELQKDLMKLSD